MERLRAIVKPELLVWARTTSGLDVGIAAEKIGVREEVLTRWERGEQNPTITQLRSAARAYKRALVSFFLPAPPLEVSLPIDFRRSPTMDSPVGLSSRALSELRQARRKREVGIELSESAGYRVPQVPSGIEPDQDPEEVANEERRRLGFGVDEQLQLGSADEALSTWKRILENAGILVFQCSRVDIKDFRAISIAERPLPFIMLNPRDSRSARVFSLFHEYAHLMIGVGGVCEIETYSTIPDRARVERFCNYFAGAFLVPRPNLLGLRSWQGFENSRDADDVLSEVARRFRVSREVILRRLLTLGIVRSEFYERKRQELIAQYQQLSLGEKEEIIVPIYRQALGWNGKLFTTFVLDAYNNRSISLSEVSDYLGVKVKHIDKIQSELQMRY
jgi:Zn-dependent peptidase ImmA (M78 family)